MDRLKGMVGKHFGPHRIFGIRAVGNDPEALVWMVDEGDDFALGVSDWPSAAKEVEGVVRV